MANYLLSSNAYICTEGNQLIVLDLCSGKYLGVALPTTGCLGNFIEGFPIDVGSPDGEVAGDPSFLEALQDLRERGILTTDRVRGRPFAPALPAGPSAYLLDLPLTERPVIRAHHVFRFLLSVGITWFSLKVLPLRRVVDRVRKRKLKVAATPVPETKQLLELVTIFNDLRPFAFGRPEQCLFHSLALIEFFASYRLFPDWIFGVRTDPFQAHCWVQTDMLSITDPLISIAELVPLMVI